MSQSLERYGSPAIALHWLTALLVIVVGTLGLLHDSWPKSTQEFWINIHALLGLLLWAVVMLRLWWRWRQPPPALPVGVGALWPRLAGPIHGALYLLLLIIPLIGIVTFLFHGRVFDFGLFQLDFGIKKNRAIFHPTEDIHGYLAYALFALAGIHLLAALWHQFVRHDGLLRRMWPAR
jgi:cytochrome b561